LNERYEDAAGHPDFPLLADFMSDGRYDTRLERIVLDTYSKLRSHPYPEDWMLEQEKKFDVSGYRTLRRRSADAI
jgi:hypothetical protein